MQLNKYGIAASSASSYASCTHSLASSAASGGAAPRPRRRSHVPPSPTTPWEWQPPPTRGSRRTPPARPRARAARVAVPSDGALVGPHLAAAARRAQLRSGRGRRARKNAHATSGMAPLWPPPSGTSSYSGRSVQRSGGAAVHHASVGAASRKYWRMSREVARLDHCAVADEHPDEHPAADHQERRDALLRVGRAARRRCRPRQGQLRADQPHATGQV